MSKFHSMLTTFPADVGFTVILLGVAGLLHCNVWPMVIVVGCQLIWGSWRLWCACGDEWENEHGNK